MPSLRWQSRSIKLSVSRVVRPTTHSNSRPSLGGIPSAPVVVTRPTTTLCEFRTTRVVPHIRRSLASYGATRETSAATRIISSPHGYLVEKENGILAPFEEHELSDAIRFVAHRLPSLNTLRGVSDAIYSRRIASSRSTSRFLVPRLVNHQNPAIRLVSFAAHAASLVVSLRSTPRSSTHLDPRVIFGLFLSSSSFPLAPAASSSSLSPLASSSSPLPSLIGVWDMPCLPLPPPKPTGGMNPCCVGGA